MSAEPGLASLTLTQMARALAAGDVSSARLVEATLARMDETEPVVRAYVHRFDDLAMDAARQADRAPRRSPLHGVPFAVKDTLFTRGTPTEAGSASLAGTVGHLDATVVARLRAAGAVLVGKHVTHEFAQGQEPLGTVNPWSAARIAGGSSAGGGASVAAGSSVLAVGTDAGGSTRMPAALTGVVGFKPTFGRISTFGTVPGAAVAGAEHIGLFTRSVADLDLVLPLVCGPDADDARSADLPRYDAASARIPRRVGVLRSVYPGHEVEATVLTRFEDAVTRLGELGVETVDLDLDLSLAGPAITLIVAAASAAPSLNALQRGGAGIHPLVKAHLQAGLMVPAAHLQAARSARTTVRRLVRDTFVAHELDALVSPALPTTPPLVAGFDPSRDMGDLTSFVSVWNLTGQPAISVPFGTTTDGLPFGVQLVGRPEDDETVVRLGRDLQPPWIAPPPIGGTP